MELEHPDFFTFTEDELDHFLTSFWWNAKMKKGNDYTASSIETIYYSLNRALINYAHNFDITHKNSMSFKRSVKAFEDSQRDCKKRGLRQVKNIEKIPSEI